MLLQSRRPQHWSACPPRLQARLHAPPRNCSNSSPNPRPCGALQSVAARERETSPRGPAAEREEPAAPAAVTNSCPMSCTALTAVRSASSCGSEPWRRPDRPCQTRHRSMHTLLVKHWACGGIGHALHPVNDTLQPGHSAGAVRLPPQDLSVMPAAGAQASQACRAGPRCGRRAPGRPRNWT